MAFHGNLQVAIKEAKTLLEAHTKLAFFAPTTGEVERLAIASARVEDGDQSDPRYAPRGASGADLQAARLHGGGAGDERTVDQHESAASRGQG